MIPPKLPIRISGEAGKRLGAQKIALELMQGTNARISLRSLASDFASWIQRDGTTVPEDDEQVCLWDADDRRIFVGRASSRFQWGKGGSYWQVTVAGPYEFMQKAQVLSPVIDPSGATAVRALKSFPRGDLTLSIRELLQMAVGQGAEFRIGNISQAFPVSQMTFKGESFHDALTDMCRWPSDIATRIRYETDGLPLLDIIRRNDAATVLVELGAEPNRCTEIEMEAQPDLVPASVEVQYVERDPVTYKPIYKTQVAGTQSGPSYKRQTLTVSGPENDSYLPGETYESESLRTLASIPWSYVKTADSIIKDVITNYGNFEMTPADGFPIELGNAHSSPSQIKTITPQVPRFYTPDGTLAAGYYALVEGSVPEWFTQYGTVIQGSVQGQYQFSYTGTGTLQAASEQVYQLNEIETLVKHSGWYVGGADIRQNFYFYNVNLPLTLISVPYAVLTEIWKKQSYEYLQPPPGLAENLWKSQQWLPCEGTAKFGPGAREVPTPGELVSVAGGPPEWRTAGVLVSETQFDLQNGSVDVTIGFSLRTEATSLIDKFRRSASDNIEQRL